MARTTRAESKAATKTRLLDAAQRLFLESGYAATSMEQVARIAGVTKPAIYRHFASKEDLFLAVRQRAIRLIDSTPLQTEDVPYADRLAEVGRGIARMTKDDDLRLLAMQLEFRATVMRRPDARKRIGAEIREFIAAATKPDSGEGPRLRPGVTDAEVLVLTQLLVEGLREYRALVPDVVTEATFGTAMSLLAHLVQPDPPRPGGARTRRGGQS